jgi:hypothetical protein
MKVHRRDERNTVKHHRAEVPVEQREEAFCAGKKTVTNQLQWRKEDLKAEDTMLEYRNRMNLSYHYYN